MLNLLSSSNKYSTESLIKELINPSFNLEIIDIIYEKLNINLNSLYINDEPILLVCCKKDLYNSVLWLLENKINIELENSLKETAIFYAIYSKDSNLLNLLLEFGANLNHLNNKNRTILQESIFNANNNIIRFLMQKSINLTNCDINGNNLLFDVVELGNLNLIKKVISLKKIDINHKNKAGNAILHLENSQKNLDLALYLLNNGANPTLPNATSINFLFMACKKGQKAFHFLYRASELGFDLNIKNSDNKNILMVAIEYFLSLGKSQQKESQAELIKQMINLDIKVQTLDSNNETIIFNITRSLDRDLIHYFLNNLEDLNLNRQNMEGFTVLFILLLNGIENIDLIRLYIEKGASLEYENKDGINAIELLINAVLYLEDQIILEEKYSKYIDHNAQYKDLLESIIKTYKFDINKLNSKGVPLFFSSILNFNIPLFKILKTKSTNLNIIDKEGNNIIFALLNQELLKKTEERRKLLITIKNLVNAGVDVNYQKDEQTALAFAIINDMEDVVKLLLDLRSDLTITDDKGRTLIHTTIFKGREKYIKYITNYSAKILDIPDSFGVKPINYAAFMGKKDVVLELINLGSTINNPNKKSPSILKFLKKYHNNILSLDLEIEDTSSKANLSRLAQNMIIEFDIDIFK